MTLPLMSALAGSRSVGRLAGAALLGLLLAAGPAPSSRAADDDPYAITVKVDGTADTVAKARDRARLDGQRRALSEIADRLGGGSVQAKLPKLDDDAITNLVASFEVADERMSAVHYVANYTYHFRPGEVQRLLRNAGIAPAGQQGAGQQGADQPVVAGKPSVLLPVYQIGSRAILWDDPNPWRQAWDQIPPQTGPISLAVPLGDAADLAAIDADKARAGDADALARIARLNGGDEAMVVLALARGPRDNPAALDVTVKRYRQMQPVESHSTSFDAKPGESRDDFLNRSAAAVAAEIEGGWKKEPPRRPDQLGSLTATVPITGLEDWIRIRDRLASASAIRKIELTTLSRQDAVIEVQYVGSIEQLKAALAEISFDLVRDEPSWRIARSAGPAVR